MLRPSFFASLCLSLCLPFGTETALADVNDANEMDTLDIVQVEAPALNEVVLANGQPQTTLSGDNLKKKIADSLGSTLEQEAGMNNASFGPGVGQPIVRGQGGPRVQVLQDSLSILDASQFSGDHANAIEPVLAERIEVLRGPATLLYGGTAIGGAVNIIDNRVPMKMPDKPITGTLASRYITMSNETSNVLKLDAGKDKLALHLDGFYRRNANQTIPGYAIDQSAYQQTTGNLPDVNTYGYVGNTSGNAIGGTAGVSYIDDWGYAGLSYNNRNDYYGIPPRGGAGDPQVNIFQTMSRYTWKNEINTPFELAKKLSLRIAYNDYTHVELDANQLNTTFTNQGFDSRLEMEHQPLGPFTGTWGLQTQNNRFNVLSAPGTLPAGAPVISPYSNIQNYALFGIEKFDTGPVSYEAGLRVEGTSINAQNNPIRTYIPFSASASALWQVNDEHHVRLAASRSQRAPQIQELYFNGYHDASGSVELGSSNLNMETSYNLDLGYQFKSDWAKADITLFQDWFNNYIYRYNTGVYANTNVYPYNQPCDPNDPTCAAAPVYQYNQQNATFMGFEANLTLPVVKSQYGNVDLDLFSDFTRGRFVAGGNVPRMPPLRYGAQLGYSKDEYNMNLRLTRANAQNLAGEYDTATPGYLLLNFNAQYKVANVGGFEFMVFAKGNNLLNQTIRNSVSFLRVWAPQPGLGGELGVQISY
ncbi:TonB-dependent receptor [Candidatus Methylospira mobilis]|uniref:TonB-dependent receptor n=1 Tax=Candidatus Methylospira mobilis TaxID=1808979 RepID=A0A5Q0BBD7_9GAMM|nr:TonB-dependent receptor [Candidatus Methylospira mobilis]QFY41235.1 TonB-dependent receptor [Candidatus Methylospira mobilis]WNV05545.1 TonB-dependent receptor [Candidatus Methylospira mobilis]